MWPGFVERASDGDASAFGASAAPDAARSSAAPIGWKKGGSTSDADREPVGHEPEKHPHTERDEPVVEVEVGMMASRRVLAGEARPEEEVRAGDGLGEVREVLRARHRQVLLVDLVGPNEPARHPSHREGALRVVLEHGVPAGDVEPRLHPEHRLDAPYDLVKPLEDALRDRLRERAGGPPEAGGGRDDVVGLPRVELADGEDRAALETEPPADHRLKGAHEVGPGHDGIPGDLRLARVRALSDELDAKIVDVRHEGPRLHPDLPLWPSRPVVEPIDLGHALEHALGDHHLGPAAANPLLGRLEHEAHVARNRVAVPGQDVGDPHQDGGVPVVPALVRPPGVDRAVRERRPLLHRQAVEVGPERDGGGPAHAVGVKVGDEPGLGRRARAVAARFEPLSDLFLGADLLEAQLGMAMDVMADFPEWLEQGIHVGEQRLQHERRLTAWGMGGRLGVDARGPRLYRATTMADLGLPDLRVALNPEQYRAATTVDGPLLVLAGAGSGKTRVLVHRIAYLLAEKKAQPWQIFAVTFTNKAAGEMRERLEHLVGPRARDAWIGTFHALSARMLRIEGHRLGYLPSFSIYDADDSKRLVKTIMTSMGIDVAGYGVNVDKVASEIDRAKNAGHGPQAFAERVREQDPPARRIAKAVYFKYQDALRRANAMDFGDLVHLATELLEHHPEAFERFGRRFRYVLVDEFQDTNQVQYAFLKALTREHENLMVVGDDDQSIYRWRGAEVAHILGFQDHYPDAEVVKLEQNYRSTGNILEAANAVIAHNRARHRKTLFTTAPAGKRIGLADLDDAEEEAALVARIIRRNLDDGREPSEHAILFRMNAQSRLFEEALRREQIPYRLVGGTGFFERMEVKDVLAYLRLLVNPTSRQDFARVVNTPTRGIGAKSVERLRAAAEPSGLEGLRMLELSDTVLAEAGLTSAAIAKLRAFGALMRALTELAREAPATEVAEKVIERIDYVEHLKKDPATADERAANVGELLSSIAEHEARAARWTRAPEADADQRPPGDDAASLGIAGAKTPLEAYLDHASLASGEATSGAIDGAQLLTLHAAKGLEFPVVFLVGLEEKTFPSARVVEAGDEAALEEERRLCYVGMTRAKEALHLTFARRRVIFGKTETRSPSRFVGELPSHVVEPLVGVESRRPRRSAAGLGPRHASVGASIHRGARSELVERAGRVAPSAAVDPFDDFMADDDPDASPFEEEEVFRTVAPGEEQGPRAGGRAHHNTFGEGEILSVDGRGGSARVHVRFADGRTKTVIARFLTFEDR